MAHVVSLLKGPLKDLDDVSVLVHKSVALSA